MADGFFSCLQLEVYFFFNKLKLIRIHLGFMAKANRVSPRGFRYIRVCVCVCVCEILKRESVRGKI